MLAIESLKISVCQQSQIFSHTVLGGAIILERADKVDSDVPRSHFFRRGWSTLSSLSSEADSSGLAARLVSSL